MKTRTRATWASYKEVSLFCLDFSGFAADLAGLLGEIEASDRVIRQQRPGSLLLAIDLHQAPLAPALGAYIRLLAERSPSPLRRVAIIGLSEWQRLWFTVAGQIHWPKNSAHFEDWEKAKAWLVGETH